MSAGVWVVPVVTAGFLAAGLVRGVDLPGAFAQGARRGLKTAVSMVPPLVLFMTVIGMFRASGALDVLSWALGPAADVLGIPREVIPLALLRPVSGSASLTVFQQILERWGPDSFSGRVASVMPTISPVRSKSASTERLPFHQSSASRPLWPGRRRAAFSVSSC